MPSSLLLRLKRVWTSATARMLSRVPRKNTPSINRTSAQTMSSVTSAVVSEPIEKSPMKCSGMWISANGTAVRVRLGKSMALLQPGLHYAGPCRLLPHVDEHEIHEQPEELSGHEGRRRPV